MAVAQLYCFMTATGELWLYCSGFKPGDAIPVGVVCLFSGVARASNKILIMTSRFYVSYMKTIFVGAKIIRLPGKNYSLLLYSKLF